MKVQTLSPTTPLRNNIIFPNQVHGINIIQIKTGQENLEKCDGIWTKNFNFSLGIKTADCAPVCLWNNEKFGIIHVGWRGLCDGICEKTLKIFEGNSSELKIFVGPLLPRFEIKKDFCFEKIQKKFGEKFFNYENNKIIFDFKSALQSVLPNTEFDPRETFTTPELASWRRNQNNLRNSTVISKP